MLRPLSVFVVACALSACGPPTGPAPRAAVPTACDPAHLEVCERALAAALDAREVTRDLVSAYAGARAAADERDAWATVHRAMVAAASAKGGPAALVVVEGASAAPAALGEGGVERVRVDALPPPRGITRSDLLLAMAEGVGLAHVIHVEGDGASRRAAQLFPHDPLEPFVVGLHPVVADDSAGARTPEDIALGRSIARALGAASELDYVSAAREADALAALVAARGASSEPALRGRYALDLLSAAGIVLDGAPSAQPADLPAPAPGDTPYGDYLRVRTARVEREAWAARKASVLRGVAADRREAVESLFAPPGRCAAPAAAPVIEGVRDMPLGARLAGALAPTGAQVPERGRLALAAWLTQYAGFAALVERTRTAWAYAPALLHQRGEIGGLRAAGTPTYARVTELGRAHLAATRKLEESSPLRYRALSQLTLVYAPGVLSDPKLTEELVLLTQATVKDKLATAASASDVLDGVVAGAFAGMSYPPAIKEAQLLALQAAFTAKLRGDLMTRTGWGVAALYAGDALLRVLGGREPDLAFSSAQIARALEREPSLPMKPLGALATSAATYAALAAERKLDLNQKPQNFHPDRRSARASLRRAIAGLGAEGEAPASVLEDLTQLADGIIAAGAWSATHPRSAAPGACAAREARIAPELLRALGKLGDVRRRLLMHPSYRDPSQRGDFARRARLLVTLLSDALDALGEARASGATGQAAPKDAAKKIAPLTIVRDEAERNLAGALADWDDRALAGAVAGAYGLLRQYVAERSAAASLGDRGQDLRRVLGGLTAFFRAGEPEADPAKRAAESPERAGGAGLLDALSSMATAEHDAGEDAAAMLVRYASRFYQQGQPAEGDLLLLATLTLSATAHRPPPRAALDLAGKQASRVEWALRLLTELGAVRRGEAPDPAAFADSMRKATDDQCERPDAEPVLGLLSAVKDFSAGRRKEARASLDLLLDKAEREGLTVPKMGYRYEEQTRSRVFTFSLEVSYGSGFLEGASAMQTGLGLSSRREPHGSMAVSFAPTEGQEAGAEAARYYLQAAALAGAYHFLDGDAERGAAAARRAMDALVHGVRLGTREVPSGGAAAWASGARGMLAIDAQLAAEAGYPFLAGDLWTVLRATLPPTTSDAEIAAVLEPRPLGLGGVKDAGAVVERAARSLRVLADPLPCTDAKADPPALDDATCAGYPLALSLRIADVVTRLPRLKRGAEAGGPRCASLRDVDAFLGAAGRGTYDPDAFTRAVSSLSADGRKGEAAVLLARHRKDTHCSPVLVGAARALGRDSAIGAPLRTDLLSLAVNCSLPAVDDAVARDLVALDAETRGLPDPTRGLHLMLFVTDLARRSGRWDLLARLTGEPGFVERWLARSPIAATAALVAHHAAAVLSGKPIDRAATAASYELLCRTLPPQGWAALCDEATALRATGREPVAERERIANRALEAVTAAVASPPGKP